MFVKVLGYLILVLMIAYGYISDLISNRNTANTIVNENQNQSQTVIIINQNSTEFETKDEKKFYRNITSTELIVILWITLIYGSALLLYLRFRVLTLERDPNSEKNKKKDSAEELNAFLQNNRKNKRSFKDKTNGIEVKVNDDSNQPFWEK